VDLKRFNKIFDTIVDNVNTVVHGKDDVVRLAMTAICAGGHVLFEDVPGVGKSVLAIALGRSMHAEARRVQCTPDMLPGDITGSSVIDTKTMNFTFRPGPVFANVLLVDEINRATPKTQSALLEAMAEKAVTVDGETYTLPKPFLVLATQNPVELAGTFPLPEAQLDRVLFRLSMGYPERDAERKVIRGNAIDLEVNSLEPVISTEDVLEMVKLAAQVELPEPVESFILDILQATRDDGALGLGGSPRASIALAKAGRVLAAADGRDTVYPEDIKALLRPVLGHRIMLTPDATLRGETIDGVLERIVSRIKPPLGVKGPSSAVPEFAAATDGNGNGNGDGDGSTRRRRARAGSGAR
jgi:MoxR-like ATPase